jgi:Protein of unknown function (DUF3142)
MLHLQLRGGAAGRAVVIACLVALPLFALAWRARTKTPRVWLPAEVPVAFWAWRDEMPAATDVERAATEARARELFVRAGQFELGREGLHRIRAAAGACPRALPAHLIYNATPDLLAQLERIDEAALARLAADTFRADTARATHDGARVIGMQLDLDVPTRLLPRYARVLRLVRTQLPAGTQLSVTGLPTWMESNALADVLAATDFWVPQCYGATIPTRLEEIAPITTPASVARSVARARELHHPFYAGLAAYGYALLYTQNGAAIDLRGNIDPARIAADPSFELIERRALTDDIKTASASVDPAASPAPCWRYVFRARRDAVTVGLSVRTGDKLMLEVPSAELLRACARAARAQAGPQLLGLCIFRLPAADDQTNLTLAQIAAALSDVAPPAALDLRLERAAATNDDAPAHDSAARTSAPADETSGTQLRVTATNTGATSALFGADACTVMLDVPTGSVGGIVALTQFTRVETLCRAQGGELQPCSLRRANVLRLSAPAFQPGARATAVFSFAGELPAALSAAYDLRLDDGRTFASTQVAPIKKGLQP